MEKKSVMSVWLVVMALSYTTLASCWPPVNDYPAPNKTINDSGSRRAPIGRLLS